MQLHMHLQVMWDLLLLHCMREKSSYYLTFFSGLKLLVVASTCCYYVFLTYYRQTTACKNKSSPVLRHLSGSVVYISKNNCPSGAASKLHAQHNTTLRTTKTSRETSNCQLPCNYTICVNASSSKRQKEDELKLKEFPEVKSLQSSLEPIKVFGSSKITNSFCHRLVIVLQNGIAALKSPGEF